LGDGKYVSIPILSIGEDKKRKLHVDVVTRGGEGVILKDLNAPYEFDRSKAWIKIKGVETYDVVIVGYEDAKQWYAEPGEVGKDGVLYKDGRTTRFFDNGWIGAIKFGLYKDGELIEVGQCSGLIDDLREEISKNKKKFIGRVIEVKCQQRMPTGGFRHCNFFRFREDKNAKDCIDKGV
jgi:ATP-dependent DNA ligase